MDLAKQHRKQGRFGEAKLALEKIVESGPGHAEALFELARVARDIGKLEISVNFMLQSLEKDESNVEVYVELGDVHAQLGNFEIVESVCRRALELQPDNHNAQVNLGRSLFKLHRYRDSIAAFQIAESVCRRALQLQPDDLNAQMNLGKSLFELGRYRESIEAFQEAVKGRPKFAEGYFELARAFGEYDLLNEAAVAYRRTLQIEPNRTEALNNLANIYLTQKKPARALSLARQMIRHRRDLPHAYYCLSLAKRFQPEDPDMQELERMAELSNLNDVDQSMVRFALGKAYGDIGAYEKAFAHYARGNAIMTSLSDDHDPASAMHYAERIIRSENSANLPRANNVEATAIPVFVTGPSRSGKSLIESLIATHNQVLAAGERNYFGLAMREVAQKAGIAEPFPEGTAKFSTQLLEDLAKTYLERFRELRRNDETHIVNTIPTNYVYVGLIMRSMPNAKVILCERGHCDHIIRIFFTRYNVEQDYAYDLRSIAAELEGARRIFSHWKGLFGDRILTVKYESLAADPAAGARRITEYLGLPHLSSKATRSINADEVGDWRNYERYLGEFRSQLPETGDQEPAEPKRAAAPGLG